MTNFTLTSPDGKVYDLTGPDGATKEQAFGILQEQIKHGTAKEKAPQGNAGLAASKSAFESAGSAGGALLGAEMGGTLGAIGGPVGSAVGALVGGVAGGYAGSKAQSGLGDLLPDFLKKATGFSPEQRAQERQQNPTASTLGSIVPDIAAAGPSLYKAAKYGADLTKKGVSYVDAAQAKYADNLAQSLKEKMTSKGTEAAQNANKAQVLSEADLDKVAKAQKQLGSRDPIAIARQVERNKVVDTSLDSLSPKKNVLAEDVGSIIQPEGQKNIAQLKATRQKQAINDIKEPAFEEARIREANGDSIQTNKVSAQSFNETLQEIGQQLERTPEPYKSQLKQRFSALKGQEVPLTAEEMRVEKLRASVENRPVKETKSKPMSLDDAEFLRRMLKSKDISNVEGFPAIDAQRMSTLADKLSVSMSKYEPRVGDYMSKYKEASKPITQAIAGRGKGLTDAQMLDEEKALFSADRKATTDYFLNGTEERASRLLDLVGGKKPQLVESLKGHFRTELEGMNAKQASDFFNNKKGLLRVFPELEKPMQNIIQTKGIAETSGDLATKRAGSAATRLAGAAKEAEISAGKANVLAEKYNFGLNQLKVANPKNSIAQSESMANMLRKDKVISDSEHQNILSEISSIKAKYGESDKAKTLINSLLRKAAYAVGIGTLGGAGLALKKATS